MQALVAADLRSCASGAPLIVCHIMPDHRDGCAPLFAQDRKLFSDMMDRAAAERAMHAQVLAATGLVALA